MTIGQEFKKLTGYNLFHNHLIIKALLPIFSFESVNFKKLCLEFRTRIFEEVIKEANNSGLIFTFVCNYNSEKSLLKLFE